MYMIDLQEKMFEKEKKTFFFFCVGHSEQSCLD